MVAIGGRGTLIGAAVGAVVVGAANTVLTGWFPEYWLFVLGAMFIAVTIFMPRGILGLLDRGERSTSFRPLAAFNFGKRERRS